MTITLDAPSQSGIPGSQLFFSGTVLDNDAQSSVDLNFI
jgi:hypothetical protein